jgi:hypothetical protein
LGEAPSKIADVRNRKKRVGKVLRGKIGDITLLLSL